MRTKGEPVRADVEDKGARTEMSPRIFASAPTVTLETVCSLLTDGTHYTPPDIGSGVPFLTVKDMTDAGLDFDRCSRISQFEYDRAAAGNSAPIDGDVLFSKDGTVGKVHVVRNEQPFAVLSSIAILRPEPGKLHPEYLAQFLRA